MHGQRLKNSYEEMSRQLMFKDTSRHVDRSTISRQCSPDGHCGYVMNGVRQNSTSHIGRFTYTSTTTNRHVVTTQKHRRTSDPTTMDPQFRHAEFEKSQFVRGR